jgi:hypothetical protein
MEVVPKRGREIDRDWMNRQLSCISLGEICLVKNRGYLVRIESGCMC